MQNRFLFFSLSLILTLGLFSSCEKEVVEESTRTILVYLGRDSDLADLSEEKIESLLKGWNGRGGNLIIYQDLYGKKPTLMEVTHSNGISRTEIIQEYEEENSADKDVFARIVSETLRLYPADSYGLILFSHASGWLPKATLSSPRSIIKDHKDEMELQDLASAIPDDTFEFIVFEACFMAGIEVAFELKDKTKYIFASSAEIVSPGFKEAYASSLSFLFKPQPDLRSFGQKVFDFYDLHKVGYYRSATFSLIQTASLDQLASCVAKHPLKDTSLLDLTRIQYFDRYYPNHLFYDFEDYYTQILADSPRDLEELRQLLPQIVVKKWATPEFLLSFSGFVIERHSGLTLYIPQERYPYLNNEYKKLKWYQQTHQ